MTTAHKTPVYKEEFIELRKQLNEVMPAESMELLDNDALRMHKEYTGPLKLKVGERAPAFSLQNASGRTVSLAEYLKKGPVIITFYRGVWCPYCNLVLNAYQRILPEIKRQGSTLMAISPQTPDQSLTTREKNKLEFEVLSDKGNIVARQFVQVFEGNEAVTAEALKLGVDFNEFNDSEKVELPIPAVYIIDRDGTVVFAKSEGGDYRYRVEPREILEVLAKITS